VRKSLIDYLVTLYYNRKYCEIESENKRNRMSPIIASSFAILNFGGQVEISLKRICERKSGTGKDDRLTGQA
jgi:hypothetical protein